MSPAQAEDSQGYNEQTERYTYTDGQPFFRSKLLIPRAEVVIPSVDIDRQEPHKFPQGSDADDQGEQDVLSPDPEPAFFFLHGSDGGGRASVHNLKGYR